MVEYDDITQTLLIDQIRIQYDSSSEWHKYLKSSLRNPHSFVYPDKQNYSDLYRNREIDFINTTCLSKGYEIKHIDKLSRDEADEEGKDRFLFEIEKTSDKKLSEDEEFLLRKIVYLFKESMQYYMSFNETDDLYGEKNKNIRKKDVKYNSDYELFKGLNDCIVSLHDSKDNRFQAMIMTNDFCGLFTPNYIRLTKYTDSFKVFLKESHILYFDLFDKEIKNNDFYKKKKEYFDYLKSSSYIPLTKGEISLANKKKIVKNGIVKSEYEEEKEINKASMKNRNDLLRGEDNDGELNKKERKKEKKSKEKKKKKKEKEKENDEETNAETNADNENIDRETEEDAEKKDQNISSREKKRKRKEDKREKKKKKKEKERAQAEAEAEAETEVETKIDSLNESATDELEKPQLCLEDTELKEETERENIEKKFKMTTVGNEGVLNYLNIKQEKDGINEQDLIPGDIKIFNLLNKKVTSDEYIYKELKADFMKEINLPNNFNYEVHMIQIHEKCVKNFYRSVVKHINKKKEKIKVYHIISNFLFFYSKMYKTYINFDDSIHKDINKNFDYKSVTIQGCILPYNFFLFLKALILMSSFKLINNFYINVTYDERRNKCLHFLNITENKFYENLKKFENNIQSKFLHIYNFLKNIIPIQKYLISKGKLYKNLETFPISHEINDVFQLTYNLQNDTNNNEIVLYNEHDDLNAVSNGVTNNIAAGGKVGGRNSDKNDYLGNNLYAIYISNNTQVKGIINFKNYFKILDDNDAITIIKDVLDINDNLTKNLLHERKILILINFYEKNMVYHHFLFNTVFFGSYISLHKLFYINMYNKNSEKIKDIPLFRPSCYGELIDYIIKRKKERELKKKKVGNLHTVDKLCNKFFKESFNKILNTKIKEGHTENLMNKLKNEDDIKKTLHNLNIQAELTTNETDDGNVAAEEESVIKNSEETTKETKTDEVETANEVKTAEVKIAEVKTAEVKTAEVKTAEVGTTETGTTEVKEDNIIINEAVIRKKEYEKLVICIFVFINANSTSFTEEEKEIRELSLNVLKGKENKIENGVKYVFKYRNNINDSATLAELEMRKNDENCEIHVIGLILCNDIANHSLQQNIRQLYDLNKILHVKYPSNKIEIVTKIYTYYWIFDVHIYGTIFLKDKEKPHLLKEIADGGYELPYIMEWKDKPLWGYHLYIVKDYIHSKYTDEMLEQLREEGIQVTICQECFEVQTFEDDLKKVLELHDLDITNLKYVNHTIYLNTLFLVENGHLIYFALMDTDNIKMKHKYNCLNIQIYNSQVAFPSFHTGTPILNDSWLMEVLEKRMLVPYEGHYYKY